MDGEQCFMLKDGGNESLEEMQRKLEESERRNAELQMSLSLIVARNQQMLEIPINRVAYRRELMQKFAAFVENRLRFHCALERICNECKSARKQTNVMTIGVGTVGFFASLQRFAQTAGSVVSLAAIALNTVLAVKGNFDEAARIRQLQKLEETDIKLIGQLLNTYDEYCTLFNIEKRIGDEDVMRMHVRDVVSSMVIFVEEIDSARLLAMTGTADPRGVIEYALFNAVFPVLAKVGSSTLPDRFENLQNMAGISAVSLSAGGESMSVLQTLASIVNGFYVLNALSDLVRGSESEAVRRMKFFIEQQKHELALFRSVINDTSRSLEAIEGDTHPSFSS